MIEKIRDIDCSTLGHDVATLVMLAKRKIWRTSGDARRAFIDIQYLKKDAHEAINILSFNDFTSIY